MPVVIRQGHGNETNGKSRMRQHPEDRIAWQARHPLQHHHCRRHEKRDPKHSGLRVESENYAEHHAEQCGMRHGVAKIGLALPKNHAASRPGHCRNSQGREQGAKEEVVQHWQESQVSSDSPWHWWRTCR